MARPSPLKRLMPASLFWRAFMILVIPILALQAIVGAVFVQRFYEGVSEQMTAAVARDINTAIVTVDEAPDAAAAEARLAALTAPFGFEAALARGAVVVPGTRRDFYDLTAGAVADALRRAIDRPLALDFVSVEKRLSLQAATTKGALAVSIPRSFLNASNPHQFVVWMTVSALVLTALATIFLRNQVRPIKDLAAAAAAFGRGRHVAFRPRGAEEVRRAGHAFLDMRARIERHIGQRTLLLSGVSHDLRTPLTRIRLAAAMLEPGPETEGIARDAGEMERMLDAFLDFVRGQTGEASEAVDPFAFAAAAAQDARRNGAEIELRERRESGGEVTLRPSAMRRCLANLIDNAGHHGMRVRLTTRLTAAGCEFLVEDDGPGIPAERREEALRPFTRIDPSRNQDRGSGVGLGLAVALDLARSHGGSLTLEDSADLGGLRAAVRLPR